MFETSWEIDVRSESWGTFDVLMDGLLGHGKHCKPNRTPDIHRMIGTSASSTRHLTKHLSYTGTGKGDVSTRRAYEMTQVICIVVQRDGRAYKTFIHMYRTGKQLDATHSFSNYLLRYALVGFSPEKYTNLIGSRYGSLVRNTAHFSCLMSYYFRINYLHLL